MRSIDARSARSAATDPASTFFRASSSSSFLVCVRSRLCRMTLQPAPASPIAICWPTPRLAPVTSAHLPLMSTDMTLLRDRGPSHHGSWSVVYLEERPLPDSTRDPRTEIGDRHLPAILGADGLVSPCLQVGVVHDARGSIAPLTFHV